MLLDPLCVDDKWMTWCQYNQDKATHNVCSETKPRKREQMVNLFIEEEKFFLNKITSIKNFFDGNIYLSGLLPVNLSILYIFDGLFSKFIWYIKLCSCV